VPVDSPVARRIRSLDHVAIAVEDMAPAAHLFVDVLGATLLSGGDNDDTGLRLMQVSCGGFKVELMQPLSDGSLISSQLARHGPGFHHMTFMVDDVPATVDALEAAGLTTVGTDLDTTNWAETFLTPRQTFGALLQFVQTELRFGQATTEYSVEDVLAGRIVWINRVACLR
jgi:methylmalonyl-CoA/ethylmalonyl-CoA epimerase